MHNNLTGVIFAKKEARSEIFADDLSAMVLRTEENLRNFSKILTFFHTVSGLKCNLDKTFVIPVGNFAKENMCQDLNLKWMDSFTVLGITIDNRLQELQQNFHRIYDKVRRRKNWILGPLWTNPKGENNCCQIIIAQSIYICHHYS